MLDRKRKWLFLYLEGHKQEVLTAPVSESGPFLRVPSVYEYGNECLLVCVWVSVVSVSVCCVCECVLVCVLQMSGAMSTGCRRRQVRE